MPEGDTAVIDPATGNVRLPFTRKTGNRDAQAIREELTEIRDWLGEQDPSRTRSADEDRQLSAVLAHVNTISTELDAVMALERLEQVRSGATGGSTRAGLAQQDHGGQRWRSGADQLVGSEEYKEWAEHGYSDTGFRTQLRGVTIDDFQQVRAPIFEWGSTGPGAGATNYDPTGSGLLLPVGQPIPPVPRQAKLYLRDLIPVMRTSLAAIPYVQELTPTADEAASAVAEGGLKPSATTAFQGAKADPTVIAATLTLSKQLFDDAPLVVQYVNGRLPYIVKFKEDWEFLNGSGTWPDIQGILGANGLLTQASSGDYAVTLGESFAAIENHDGDVSAVVMNPTDAWAMFTKRAAGGSGTFDAGTPFSALPLSVWGKPTYRTRAKAAGTALTADFQRGATILDRETVNVQTYRERYAELNEVLLICEERVGLMIQRPDLFCNVTLP